jgi:environmental stress-induced protein Ves
VSNTAIQSTLKAALTDPIPRTQLAMTLQMLVYEPRFIDELEIVSWKNGAGVTRILVVEPETRGSEKFAWRLSLAYVTASCSFSPFPGIDRTILLWSGQGMILRSSSWPEHAVTKPNEPFKFAGEQQVTCEPINGPIADLNLMINRDCAHGTLTYHDSAVTLAGPRNEVVVACANGKVRICFIDRPEVRLFEGQFLRISRLDGELVVRPEESTSRFVFVTIDLLGPSGI